MDSTERLHETAADELARLDTTCLISAPAASAALGIALAARGAASASASPDPAGAFHALTVAHADPAAESRTPEQLLRWRDWLAEEERRARSGVALTAARLAAIPPRVATPAAGDEPGHAHRVPEVLLRDPAPRGAPLHRALALAAHLDDPVVGEAAAALVLVGAGRTDRLRIAPFGAADPAARAEPVRAFRTGDEEPWRRLALGALAESARALRLAVAGMEAAHDGEEARLAVLGRGGITARDALAVLREAFACTMPSLADRLGVSRPAAADALERLVATGIAREVTGRRRDRVYAYEAAFRIGAAASA